MGCLVLTFFFEILRSRRRWLNESYNDTDTAVRLSGYWCFLGDLGEVIVLLRILAVALDELALDETLDALF